MVKFSTVQRAFSAGEISPLMFGRQDMDVYFGALAKCKNFIPDKHGALHRRPGTRFVEKAKGKPCFYNFDAGKDCPTVIAATPNCFQFFVDGELFGDLLDTPYGDDDYCDLQMVDDCGASFIVHKSHAPRYIQKTETGFELKLFESLPYDELNPDASCRLCLAESEDLGVEDDENSRATLTAEGCEPFTAEMVGRLVRILDEEGVCRGKTLLTSGNFVPNVDGTGEWDQVGYENGGFTYEKNTSGTGDWDYVETTDEIEDESDKNEPNTWLSLRIVEFVSTSEVVVEYQGCKLKCTDLFCLPGFSDGVYPSSVWIHQDRLWFGKENCLFGSKTGNFFDWEKTDPDGTVNPDNAVYAKLNAGECHEIQWIRSQGNYLIAGTDHSIYAVSGGSGAIQADDYAQQIVQSVGVSRISPASIMDRTVFVDRSCTRLFSLEPGVNYDQLSMVEHTAYVDHIGARRFKIISFQNSSFPLLWAVMEDGTLFSMTYWPGQGVRGWAEHCLGGSLSKKGCEFPPDVCAVMSQRESDGKDDVTYFAVKRTIDGEDVYFIETLGKFFTHSMPIEDAHYLDAAFKIKGDVVTMPDVLDSPNLPTSLSNGRYALRDQDRWHYGTAEDGTLSFDTPNTLNPTHGYTLIEGEQGFSQLEPTQYGEKPEFVGIDCCLYDPPCDPIEMVQCEESFDGFECFETESLVAYLDGFDCGIVTVSEQSVGAKGCIGWIGYQYVSEAQTLPWRANLGATDGANDKSSLVRVAANVFLTPSLYCVHPHRNTFTQEMETCDQLICEQSDLIWGRDLFSGWVDCPINTAANNNDEEQFIIRASEPYPATIRMIEITRSVQGRV